MFQLRSVSAAMIVSTVVIMSCSTCYGAGLSYNELYTEFQAGAPVTIVDSGVAQFKIVCSVATWSPDDTNPAGLAAYELRDYIQQITGVQLPTSGVLPGIYIGDDANPGSWSQSIKDQMEQFGYRIMSSSSGIYIAGNPDSYRPDNATANGVYAFIEKALGVRWFTSIPVGTYVPSSSTLTVGTFDIIEAPVLKGHTYGPTSMTFDTLPEGALDDYFVWYKRNRLGGQIYGCRHNYHECLNPWTYLPAYPEYYSLINGERIDARYSISWQICHSNPDGTGSTPSVPQQIASWINAKTNTVFQTSFGWNMPNQVYVSANDYHSWCECGPCAALGTVTDQTVTMLNRIAQLIEPVNPGRIITFYAYSGNVQPPSPGVTLEPNLMPLAAPYGFDLSTPFETPGHAFRDVILGWAGKATQWGTRDYYTYTSLIPWANARVLADNIEWLTSLGCIYTNAELIGLCPIDQIAWYMAAKKSFNPSLNTDDIFGDFFDKYYGPAAVPMWSWYTTAENAFIGGIPSGSYSTYKAVYNTSVLNTMESYLDQAAVLATTAPYDKRVADARLSLDLTRAWVIVDDAKDALMADWTGENYTALEDAYNVYRALLDQATDVVAVGAIEKSYLFRIEEMLQGGTTFYVPDVEYNEAMNNGGYTQRDAIEIIGFVPGTWGMYLYPWSSGIITWEFDVADGVFDQLQLTFYFNSWIPGNENALLISVDDGQSWSTVMQNTDCSAADYDLTPYVQGYQKFLFRQTATNNTGNSRLILQNFNFIGNAVYSADVPIPAQWFEYFDDIDTHQVGDEYIEKTIWEQFSTWTSPNVVDTQSYSGSQSLYHHSSEAIMLDLGDTGRIHGTDLRFSVVVYASSLGAANFNLQAGPNQNGRARLTTSNNYFAWIDGSGTHYFDKTTGGYAATGNNSWFIIEMTFHWNYIDYGTTYDVKIWYTRNTYDRADDMLYVDAQGVPMLLQYEWVGIAPNYLQWFLVSGAYQFIDDVTIERIVPMTPNIISITPDIAITFEGDGGIGYEILYKSDLMDPDWISAGAINCGDTETTWTDQGNGDPGDADYRPPPSEINKRFYQIRDYVKQ